MHPLSTTILNVRFSREGFNYVDFISTYPTYKRRGTVVYDTREQKFYSHKRDIELILSVVRALSTYKHIYS